MLKRLVIGQLTVSLTLKISLSIHCQLCHLCPVMRQREHGQHIILLLLCDNVFFIQYFSFYKFKMF